MDLIIIRPYMFQYPKKDELDAANNKVASSIKLFDNGSDEIDLKNQGRIVTSTKFDSESIVTSGDKFSNNGIYSTIHLKLFYRFRNITDLMTKKS